MHLVVELSCHGEGWHVESESMGGGKGNSQVPAFRFCDPGGNVY